MPKKLLLVVEDLFFLAKVQETARRLSVDLEGALPGAAVGKLIESPCAAVILDLNHRSGCAIETLHALKEDLRTRSIPVIGFLSHVQGDLAAAARAAGCDVVMARSAFSQHLPEILAGYAEKQSVPADMSSQLHREERRRLQRKPRPG